MNINVYNYLLDNNLLEDFVVNFSVKRKILNINKEITVGKAYYKENERDNGKGKKEYDRIPLNVYKWTYEVQSEYIIFGNKFTTTQQFSGISSDENEIPFGKKGNYYTQYMHMSSVSVKEGQTVARGQKIGTMGNTGHVVPTPAYGSKSLAGTHLHFEVRVKGKPVNPLPYLP